MNLKEKQLESKANFFKKGYYHLDKCHSFSLRGALSSSCTKNKLLGDRLKLSETIKRKSSKSLNRELQYHDLRIEESTEYCTSYGISPLGENTKTCEKDS